MPTAVQEEETLRSFPDKDQRWKLVERIAAAPGFAKSARLSSLLLYIVRQSLQGKDEELNEQLIGERVFGRPIGYDPRDDNIVRAHASRLRQRLEIYFREEGKEESLRITIPRGSYLPLFERTGSPLSSESHSPAPVEHATDTTHHTTQEQPVPLPEKQPWRLKIGWSRLVVGLACIFLLALPITKLVRARWALVAAQSKCPTQKLWSAIFNGNSDTLIVPADSSLVVLKALTGHRVSIADYASGRYLSQINCEKPCDPQLLQTLAQHRYTSLADLKFAVDLTHMPEAVPGRTEIRYARDLQLDDLKQSNLILIGSLEADPWLELFQRQMNFDLQDDKLKGPLEIENRKPLAGESADYVYDENDPSHRGFASVAFLPNLSGSGNVLIVQGFTLAGTQAAAEFVSSDRNFDALFNPMVGSRQALPHFEILLRTMDVNGLASPPAILAYRIYR
jgi:hypothetical protein